MSRDLPPFLAELGLDDADAALDERALRRAYARRLKLIDIEAEPQRFQDLREALEAALRWSAARERAARADAPAAADRAPDSLPDTASADATPSPPAAPAPAPDAAQALAEAVFAAFQPQVATLLDRALAVDALQHALADDRLASIDARTFFEWRVARLLAEGWQRGHEHLLAPAVETFGWEGDHARLANFGQVGALLEAAIRDIAITQSFTEAQKVAMVPLLERLRAGAPPDPASLADEIAALQFLVQRVPNWLRLVAPVEPVNARFQMWGERPAPVPAVAALPLPAPPPRFLRDRPLSGLQFGATLLVMAVWVVLRLVDPGSTAAPRPPSPAALEEAGRRELEQRQRQVDTLLVAIRRPPAASASR